MPARLADHLHLLVCPVCHGALALSPARVSPVAVDCTVCKRRYPIVDDLPVLIASRATLPS